MRPQTTVCGAAAAAGSSLGGVALAAVLRVTKTLVDLLAPGTDRELARIPARDPHLAAERDHRLAAQGGLHDLLLAHVVRKAFVVPGFRLFPGLLALEDARTALRAGVVLRVREWFRHAEKSTRDHRQSLRRD